MIKASPAKLSAPTAVDFGWQLQRALLASKRFNYKTKKGYRARGSSGARGSEPVIALAEKAGLNVRFLAAEILAQVDTRKAYADILLDRALKTRSMDERDRALLTEIVYGTLRWRAKIDAELSTH